MADVLVVDNHDSFVHTLVGYLDELGADTDLVEADAIDPDAAASVIAVQFSRTHARISALVEPVSPPLPTPPAPPPLPRAPARPART